MAYLLKAVMVVFSFLAMEGFAWLIHRYIMHGPMWFLHRDHHQPDDEQTFQNNDFFLLLFSAPGIALLILGLQTGWESPLTWAGVGISIYGIVYFWVHEGVIHRRFRMVPRARHPYFVALRRAHGAHHGQRERTNSVCFGMLAVPWQYFRDAYQKRER